jgi:hypothetical protein
MPKFTIKSRYGDHTFECNHTSQQQLYDRLVHLISKEEIVNEHANRLIAGYRKYGSWKDYHEAWAAFHVTKHDHPERFQGGNRVKCVPGFTPILEHLQGAGDHLKSPIITLEVGPKPDKDHDGFALVLRLLTRGKRPGCVSVASSARYGEGTFYGYIDLDGTFEARAACTPPIVDLLQRVAVDPPRVISEIGRQSGRCCYCPAKLTQVQSKIAGCGKTCAGNYNVPYPNAARTREVLVERPEYLEGSTDRERWCESL